MTKIIKHIVTDMDESMIQNCIICGYEIVNYQGAMWPNTQKPPKGFAAGEVYVTGKNPTCFYTSLAEDEEYQNCKP